jgi:hypothetical protein
MTRSKAYEIARAVDNLDGFEACMDSIYSAVRDAEGCCEISDNFQRDLKELMNTELQRLKQILEDM